MKFKTRNSIYEVDTINKRIRRVDGEFDPTPRQGLDLEWKKYQLVSELEVGEPVVILWEQVQGVWRSTVTSPIKEILPDED